MMGIKIQFRPVWALVVILLQLSSPALTTMAAAPNNPAPTPAVQPTPAANKNATAARMSATRISGYLVAGFVGLFVLLIVARVIFECGHRHASGENDDTPEGNDNHAVQEGELNQTQAPRRAVPLPPVQQNIEEEPQYENINRGQNYQDSRV